MPVTFRMVPSAGPVISFGDVFKVFGLLLSGKNYLKKFESSLSETFNGARVHTLLQGRVAMFVALEILKKQKHEKTEVLIPAYTCESVYYAVKRANLTPVLYDISKDYPCSDPVEINKKITEQTLAVISVSMYGIAYEADEIVRICKNKNIFLIEDIAQSYGLKNKDVSAGLIGDVGVLSFGKSKNLSSILGGALVTKNENLAVEIGHMIAGYKSPGFIYNLKILLNFLISFIIIKPFFFKLITSLKKDFTTHDHNIDQPLSKPGKAQVAIGLVLFKKLEKINNIRQKNGRKLLSLLKNISSVKLFDDLNQESIYLRFPITVNNPLLRDELLRKLRSNGYWVMSSSFPPLYLCSRESESDYSHTSYLESNLLVLPTHPYLKKNDPEKISKIIKQVCENFKN